MKLAQFILSNLESILAEWDSFASTIIPDRKLDKAALRDEAEAILRTIAADMDKRQTPSEQAEKSKGHGPREQVTSAAEKHASDRLRLGFDQAQVVSEYRALRASVIRLWLDSSPELGQSAVDQLTRFNEAIDQALTESVARFMQEIEKSRDFAVAVLAHDLRNPLTSIMSSSQYFERMEGADRATIGHLTSSIIDSGVRMGKMIENLLDFTRTRLGQSLPVRQGLTDLADVCRQTVAELRSVYAERTIHFNWSGDLHGRWDAARISQMLSNLIANAIQHGDQTASVAVQAHAESEEIVVRVHNKGFSHALTELPRGSILAFQQTRPLHQPAHLGVGLFVAQKIAEAHEGILSVTSTPQAGTTFEVRLPRNSADDSV
jgi:signal transduction histidine kinase